MRRGAPELLVALLIALVLGWYVWYTQSVVRDLRQEAELSTRMYARVYRALNDTSEAAGTQAVFELSHDIKQQGVPVVVTDKDGRPTAAANTPYDSKLGDPGITAYVHRLDAENPPVVDTAVGEIHYGNTRLVHGLQVIPALQALTAAILLLFGVYIVRTRGHAARERIWAGMARESAHQLGTPLSSLGGWIELLEEHSDDTAHKALSHMRADLERLDRVAHRFERIGREPRRERVDVRQLVDRIATYFRARVPTLANTVRVDVRHEGDLPAVLGDPVLLEWALEVLAKNSIDALSGRGGCIELSTSAVANGRGGVRIRVHDNGPGVPRELRGRIFEPGFSTKQSGWGIGLSLAKRIVEENHGGKLVLAPSEPGGGATFDVILH